MVVKKKKTGKKRSSKKMSVKSGAFRTGRLTAVEGGLSFRGI